jgi:hypothetical protein
MDKVGLSGKFVATTSGDRVIGDITGLLMGQELKVVLKKEGDDGITGDDSDSFTSCSSSAMGI